MLRDLAAFHLFRAPIPIFVSLVDIRLRVSCDFAAVKFCLSEGIHAGTTSLVRACGERRNSPKLKNPSSSYIFLSFEKSTSDLSSHGYCHSRRRYYRRSNCLLPI